MRFCTCFSLALIGLAAPIWAQSPSGSGLPTLPGVPSLPRPSSPATAGESPDSATTTGSSLGDEVSPEDQKLIDRLELIRLEFEKQQKDVSTGALSRFSSAASSDTEAARFYVECRQMLFKRSAPNITDPEALKAAREAYEKQMENLEKEFKAVPARAMALKFQLEYLVLTIRARDVENEAVLASELRSYISKVMDFIKAAASDAQPARKIVARMNSRGSREQQDQRKEQVENQVRKVVPEMLSQGVLGSVYAQAWNLSNYFKPRDGWSDTPLDLKSHYQKYIFPRYHETRKEELGSAWDEFIGYQMVLKAAAADDLSVAKWRAKEYKDLQWDKWMDILRNGVSQELALSELTRLVKENGSHTGIGRWSGDLGAMIDMIKYKKPATPPASASPEVAPATSEGPVTAPADPTPTPTATPATPPVPQPAVPTTPPSSTVPTTPPSSTVPEGVMPPEKDNPFADPVPTKPGE